MPPDDRRRTENSLKIWIYEVKGLSNNKNYFCEIHVDDKIYAKTFSTSTKKTGSGMCFWGECFTFSELPKKVDKITILIYKDRQASTRRQRKPVGRVKICVSSIQSRREVEKWYSVEKSSRREAPSIRLKCQFQSIDILPLRDYEQLSKFLKDDYKTLCKSLEPHITVKVKEELSSSMMSVFKIQDIAEDILADIVVHEIASNENESLTFRGNSIATKAMEAYIKLVGEKYLEETLKSCLQDILARDIDLEVDPIKVNNNEVLNSHRQDLRSIVTIVWRRIANSHSFFPVRLQRCFHKIRQYLEQVGKQEIAYKLVSSCIFLRYLCPAILGPNLFNLTDEYPNERSSRNLTLIAKTLQTLANFARYEGKENSMEFMNQFLDEESGNMRKFLELVSGPPPEDWIHGLNLGHDKSDLGRHLSALHTILVENVSKIPASCDSLDSLRTILNDISNNLHRPSTSTLDSIAEPTPMKIKRISVEEKSNIASNNGSTSNNNSNNNNNTNSNNSGGGGGGISNWMSWTLGRGDKGRKTSVQSHPIPQHSGHTLFGRGKYHNKTETSTESSSSSTSLTPSPKYTESDPRLWHHQNRKTSRISASSISIIDDSDSESSSASSHYRATNTNTVHAGYSTLPRPPRTETKTLTDYEREIHGLRSAMETLQVKLHDAERKLQAQQASGSSTGSERSTTSPRQSPTKDENLMNKTLGRPDDEVKVIVSRLLQEEDILRRDQIEMATNIGDKEMMILLQQRKIAALDEANNRLLNELSKLGEKVGYRNNNLSKKSVQEPPKTVDELLDSFSDTRV